MGQSPLAEKFSTQARLLLFVVYERMEKVFQSESFVKWRHGCLNMPHLGNTNVGWPLSRPVFRPERACLPFFYLGVAASENLLRGCGKRYLFSSCICTKYGERKGRIGLESTMYEDNNIKSMKQQPVSVMKSQDLPLHQNYRT